MNFKNRTEAGRKLAEKLTRYAGKENLLILALPRGGVPVAFEVAKTLRAPLDVFVVRKLGVPGQEELAMGAIASGGVRVLNEEIIRHLGIFEDVIARISANEQRELERREFAYRGGRAAPDIAGKKVILVDDGLATGATMRAAVNAIKAQGPEKLIVAVPTGAPDTCDMIRKMVDEIVCLITPTPFGGVGAWYQDFSQTSDREVQQLLKEAEELVSEASA
ncbi:MAG: phosphoribosyltransferase [Deltaproteobacteria bacterium]